MLQGENKMTTRKQKAEPNQPASKKTDRPHTSQSTERHPQSAQKTTVPPGTATDQDLDRQIPDRTAGQNHAVDQKRNDEQQYHAAGVAHDPHNRTQERIDKGDPEAGDINDETRSQSAPFNKTYGHHP
jgi:hypothetical protein